MLVQRFRFEGNQVYTAEQLQAVIAGWEGKELTLDDIYHVSDVLTAFYRRHGYMLATVNVPAQRVRSGVIRLEVVEGRLEDVRFEGNQSYSTEFLGRRLRGVRAGQVLTARKLERDLLLLNDLPGLTARSVIEPGRQYGTSDLLVRTQEKRIAGSLRLDNYGRVTVGEWRLEAEASVNNPLAIGDQLNLLVTQSGSAHLRFGRLSYSLPVDDRGTRGTISYSRFLYDVAPAKAGVADSHGDGSDWRVQLSHPVVRSRQRNVLASAGFVRQDNYSSTDPGTGPQTSGTYIGYGEFSVLWAEQHKDRSQTLASAVLSGNFKHNHNGSRANALKGKLQVNLTHVRALTPKWVLQAQAEGVLSVDPLPNGQQYRIGGPGNVRGFPSSELSGDNGYRFSLEASRPLPLWQGLNSRFRVFWDGGVVLRSDASRAPGGAFAVVSAKGRESLTDIGAGLSLPFSDRLGLDLEYVRPTDGHTVSDGRRNDRYWAVLTATF